jgi:type II secretory pathway component PulC
VEGIFQFGRELIMRKSAAWIACVIASVLLFATFWQFGLDMRQRAQFHARLNEKVEIPKPKPATALPEQIAFGLFGKRPISPDMYAPASGSIHYELHGVLATTDGQGGSATIVAPGAGEHTYVVGDVLPGQSVIKAIFSDRVVIERNKRLETILLPPRGLPAK